MFRSLSGRDAAFLVHLALVELNLSQSNNSNASLGPSAQNAGSDCPPVLPNHANAQARATGDDFVLIELGRRFEEITARVQTLYGATEPDGDLAEIEATLSSLEPIEYAIMTMPACTSAGLGVKARHAAYVMSEYWSGSIDQIDWDARAVRLLIEAVCTAANVPLPFLDGAGDAGALKQSGRAD